MEPSREPQTEPECQSTARAPSDASSASVASPANDASSSANDAGPPPAGLAPQRNLETCLISSGRSLLADSLAPTLFPSTIYSIADTEEARHKASDLTESKFYGRHGNPSVRSFEEAMAELEGAESARAFSSGMGAIASVVLALCQKGDHIVTQQQVFSATLLFFQWVESRLGIDFTFVDATQPEAFSKAVATRPATLVFVETPTNPSMSMVDLEELGAIRGPVVVVDSTAAPPVMQRPLAYGVDLSLHSATKYIAGHNDAMLGVVSGSQEVLGWVRSYAVLHGANASPFDAMNGLRGLRTMGVRVARQSETAMKLAQMLEEHPLVGKVWYPGLKSHPDHGLAARQMEMFGGLLTFEIEAGGATGQVAGAKFIESVQVARQASSFGGPETLVIHPATTTHAGLSTEELAASNITASTVRVSVGLEHAEDLIADFRNSLELATG